VARPTRRLRLVFLAALSLLLGAGAALLWQADTRALRRRLVAELRERAAVTYPRPVQSPPAVPGRFGPLAAGAWDTLAAQEGRSTDVEFCKAVREGEAPFEGAPASCLRELYAGAPALAALLSATHAEEAGPPAGLGFLDVPQPEAAPRTWVTAAYAAKMAALRLRTELAAGQPEVALGTCLDLLGLARDSSWGTALEGRAAALSIAEVAFGPCAAALDAAPLSAKRRAAVALGHLADGTPSLAETLSDWSVGVRAQLLAPLLAESLPTLPPGVQAWAQAPDAWRPQDFTEAVLGGRGWHRLQARLDAVVEAARLPPDRVAPQLTALSAPEPLGLPGLERLALPDLGAFSQSDARVRAQLLLLRRAAEVDALRAETGAWPRPDAEGLSPSVRSTAEQPFQLQEKGVEALLTDASVPRGALEVHLHADRSRR